MDEHRSFLKREHIQDNEKEGILSEKDQERIELERLMLVNKEKADASLAWASTIHGVDTYMCAKLFAFLGTFFLGLATYHQVIKYPWKEFNAKSDHPLFFVVMFLRLFCFYRLAVKASWPTMIAIFILAVYGVYDQIRTVDALMYRFRLDVQRLSFVRWTAISVDAFPLYINQEDFTVLKTVLLMLFHAYTIIVGTKYLVAVPAEKYVKFVNNMRSIMEGKEAPSMDDVIQEYQLPRDENKRKSIVMTTVIYAVISIFLICLVLVTLAVLIKMNAHKKIDISVYAFILYMTVHLLAEILILVGLRTKTGTVLLSSILLHVIHLPIYVLLYICAAVPYMNASNYTVVLNTTIFLGSLFAFSFGKIKAGLRCYNYMLASKLYFLYQAFDEKHSMDADNTIANGKSLTNLKWSYL